VRAILYFLVVVIASARTPTERLKDGGDEAAFDEQQRLRTARDEADRQLATLFEADGD